MRHRMQALYDSSIRDSLTGLLNRRGAIGVINKSLAQTVGSNATLLIDVDDLKKINDLRGHVAGDVVIACTAEVVRQSIREGDTCARIGGDEFIVFAPDCDLKGANEIARKIVAKLSKQEMLLAGASELPRTKGQTQTLPECIEKPTKRCIRRERKVKAASVSSPLPASRTRQEALPLLATSALEVSAPCAPSGVSRRMA